MSQPTTVATVAAAWNRFSWIALLVGLVAGGILAVTAWGSPTSAVPRILPGYLTAFLYFLGLSMGSAVILMIHGLTGGRWGMFVGRALSAAVAPLPLLALAFLPIVLGVEQLFPWAMPGAAEHHPLLAKKLQFLNVDAFQIRAAIYFGLWLILCFCVRQWTRPGEAAQIPARRRRLACLSGPGLIGYGLSMTFAAVDWNMSLMPDWYSSMLPVIVWGGQVMSAMALAIWSTIRVSGIGPWPRVTSQERLGDVASLLFTMTMFWAYTSFMQFLIIWSGNLPHEVIYYFGRTAGSWFPVFLIVVVFGWAIPYFSLLLRPIKTNPRRLSAIVALVVVTRFVDTFWWIMPSVYPQGLVFGWEEVLSLLAIGGLWSSAYASRLAQSLGGPIEEFGIGEWTSAVAAHDHH